MLSPGQYHKFVSRDPKKNVQQRLKLYKALKDNPELQKGIREICKRDILFFVLLFVWQVNPRKKGHEVGPFVLWDFQDEAILKILRHLNRDTDLLIEKSREMGASWLCLIVMVWCCLFHSWKKFLCISHTEQAVDREGDSDSLFWKINFMHQKMPNFLTRGVQKLKLRFNYPATDSSITGASTSERSGVGGRATGIFLDEFSKQKDDYAILGQTADTGCRIFNGTHYGTEQAFFELTQRVDLSKLVMHWSQHPDKRRGLYRYNPVTKLVEQLDPAYRYDPEYRYITDGTPNGGPCPGIRSPWYDAECRRRVNARDIAMHLDIDPQGSVTQVFNPATIRELIFEKCRPPLWEGELIYDSRGGVGELFRKPGGPIKLWIELNQRWLPEEAEYGAGVDCALGTGNTPSCLSIISGKTGWKVLEYQNAMINPQDFAVFCVSLCKLFANEAGSGAMLAWEKAGPGTLFGRTVKDLGYVSRIHMPLAEDKLGRARTELVMGFNPSSKEKDALIKSYQYALERRFIINFSEHAMLQTLVFRIGPSGNIEHPHETVKFGKQSPDQARINHADMVFADSLAWMMAKPYYMGMAAPKKEEKPVVKPNSMQGRREARRLRELEEEYA